MAALNNPFTPTVTHTRAARNAIAVTPSDSTDLPQLAYHGLIAQAAGNVKVDMIGGGQAVVIGIAAGIRLPVQVRRVYSTNTTATGIVALY